MNIHPLLQGFDPTAVGFRCGLEVHQQLLTDEKLFCHCPVLPYSNDYDTEALRHMRPTLSELGEYDGTALMEFKTKKQIIYRIKKESVCTYEMDDNPPFRINPDAVDIVIEIALLMNCSIVDELHIIRKQYLDGSIPAGFQRSALVGLSGWIPYGDRKIRIRQVAIEEDSCREYSDSGHLRICMTDRLSIPLIEVVTEPDILTPKESFEVGSIISKILRSTQKVRRGLGRVRQDVNVSVEGGTRIEIKGVPRLKLMPGLVHYEAYRQHRLLGVKELMLGRGITESSFEADTFDLTGKLLEVIPEDADGDDNRIGVIVLRGMKGLLNSPIGPERTFADDIAGRIKVIACLNHFPMLRHSEGVNGDGLSEADMELLIDECKLDIDHDSVVVVWGSQADVKTALSEIAIRCGEAAEGIPSETRQALQNSETEFERILPGPNRMYPDTDLPYTEITKSRVAEIAENLPEFPWVKEKKYRKLGLSGHFAELLVLSGFSELFDRLVDDENHPPVLTAHILIDLMRYFNRISGDMNALTEQELEVLFSYYQSGSFSKEGFRLLIEASSHNRETDWELLMGQLDLQLFSKKNAADMVRSIVNSMEQPDGLDEPAMLRYVMGCLMDKLRGKIDGSELLKIVKEDVVFKTVKDKKSVTVSLKNR